MLRCRESAQYAPDLILDLIRGYCALPADDVPHYPQALPSPMRFAMPAPALPRAEPESVGLSSARLRRIGEALRRDIEAAQLPGAVVGIMRGGKLAHLEAVGYRDPATREPL